MKNKNVKFIITIDEQSGKRIIPVDDFNYFFNVITKFRTKKVIREDCQQNILMILRKNSKKIFPILSQI